MTKIIVELGQNHMGDEKALTKMMLQAAEHADIVKFQYWNVDKIYHKKDSRYKAAKERELKYDSLTSIMSLCKKPVLLSFFGATPKQKKDIFDPSHKNLMLKYASSEFDMFLKDAQQYKEIFLKKFIIVSLGYYAGNIRSLPKINGIYLTCAPKYPTIDYTEALTNMKALEALGHVTGFSDHSVGLEACKAAITMKAAAIEKHFTTEELRATSKFRDHICSMTVEELKLLKEFRDDFVLNTTDQDFIYKNKDGKRRLKSW